MRREGELYDRDRLEHMLRGGRDAVPIAAGRTRADLDRDLLLQHALVHCVEIVGEAAARVSDQGHILVHAYYRVDYDGVWRVVTEHIPQMIPLLEQALAAWPERERDAGQGPT